MGEVEGEVTKRGRGAVRLRGKFSTMSSLYSRYMYKQSNKCISCIYKCFRSLYPTACLTLQKTGSIQGSEVLKEKNCVPAVTRKSAIYGKN